MAATTGPWDADGVSLAQAAQLTGRSHTTVRRYLDADRFPNAYRVATKRVPEGEWRIPVTDLLGVGWTIDDVEALDPAVRMERAEALARDRAEHIGFLRSVISELMAALAVERSVLHLSPPSAPPVPTRALVTQGDP